MNRDPAGEPGPVEKLARRIASFPAEAVRLAKQSVNQSDRPLIEGLFEEAYLFDQTLRTAGAKANMRRFLEIGGQTREGELRMGELCAELGAGDEGTVEPSDTLAASVRRG